MIDPATGWFEIHQYVNKRDISVANIVEQEWLCRYPWPSQVITDRGSEFIGQEFKDMIKRDYGVVKKVITTRNPQANAVVERIHQVLANMVRTFELEDKYLDADDPWKGILSAVAFAVRSTIHTTTQSSPAQLVFGRDMMLNITHKANWEFIRARKQEIINKNNVKENRTRIPHKYKVGDKVLLKRGTENKYEIPFSGPHLVTNVYDNGTIGIQNGAVTDTVNIRRVFPYQTPRVHWSPDIVQSITKHGGECNAPTFRRSPRLTKVQTKYYKPKKAL